MIISLCKRYDQFGDAMMQRRAQVHTSIIELLKERIASGGWAVGQRLPSIVQLARQFGVGTGSVREAVKALSSLGIVRVEHGRGIFVVAVPNMQDSLYASFQNVGTGLILELCEARRILEPELAALAAERGTEAELQDIHEQAALMEQRVMQKQDFLEPDVRFHECIAQAAHNQVLSRMLAGVSDLLLDSRRITMHMPGMDERTARYHLLIADAINKRDPFQARLLMLAHVNDAIDGVLAWQGQSADGRSSQRAPPVSPVVLMQRSLTSPH